MRALIALPLIFATAACGAASRPAPPAQTSPDTTAIVTAAILHSTRIRTGNPICVSVGSDSFELMPAPSRSNLRRDWVIPSASGRPATVADAGLRARLDAALNARAKLADPGPIDPARLSPKLRAASTPGLSPECPAHLGVSSPWGTGDIAFVETGYVCGGLCGDGEVLALERSGGEWRVVAVNATWIS